MKHTKTKIIPERQTTYTEKITCDFCSNEIDMKKDSYHKDKIKIEHRKGYNYPDNGHGIIKCVDMCVDCFYTKLVPWINSQGVDLHKEEWDW